MYAKDFANFQNLFKEFCKSLLSEYVVIIVSNEPSYVNSFQFTLVKMLYITRMVDSMRVAKKEKK